MRFFKSKVLTLLKWNRMRNLFLALLFTLALVPLSAQQRPFNTGLLFDDEAYSKVPHLPRYNGDKYNEVPLKVSLRKYAPFPGDQEIDGSCTAWAAAYGGLSICRAIADSITNRNLITQNANSVYFVFNQTRRGSDCSYGAKISDALELMKAQGACLATTFKDTEKDCNKQPSDVEKAEAENYQIKDYAAAFSIEAEPEYKVNKTKKLLAANSPVVVGMSLTESFWLMEPGETTWSPKATEQGGKYGHAMLVVGYDEVKKSFEIMNSWGAEWGDKGFFWIKYEDFGRLCKYGFQIILNDKVELIDETTQQTNVITKMEGEFVFRYPTGYVTDAKGQETIAFEEAGVVLNSTSGIYQTTREKWKVGDVFQLVAKNIPAGKNAYIFSIDAVGKTEVHWPPEAQEVDAADKVPIANFVPSKNAEIIIPDQESALQISQAGTDHLVILFSDERIEDFEQKVLAINLENTDINQQLTVVFGDILAPLNDIELETDKMAFKGTINPQAGYVVPIILAVQAN